MANVLGIIKQPITHEWETPPDFFAALDAEFGFTLDAAANADNAKCLRYYDNFGLALPWEGVVFCNPPYGTQIGKWVEKGHQEARKGATVVMLIPARTETAWFQSYVFGGASEIYFVSGRLRFSGSKVNAPFPSCVVVFRQSPLGGSHPLVGTMSRSGQVIIDPLPPKTSGWEFGEFESHQALFSLRDEIGANEGHDSGRVVAHAGPTPGRSPTGSSCEVRAVGLDVTNAEQGLEVTDGLFIAHRDF